MHLVAIGGSDAGISAALRARELDPDDRGHRRRGRRLPQLLHLRHPLLRLGRGHPLAQPGAPHPRRPQGHRDAGPAQHAGHQDRRRRPPPPRGRRGRGRGPDRLRPARGRHRRRLGPPAHRGTGRPRCAGSRRRRPPAPLHGRHLRAGAHARGGPAGQRGDRGRRLHRPRDGRGPPGPGAVGDPVRAAPRGAPDRRPESRCVGQRRADAPRHRRADQHDGQADRPGPAGIRPAASRSTSSSRRAPSSPSFADLVLVVVGVRPDTALAARPGPTSASGGRSAWTGACGPTSTASSPPGTAS